jgi:hypothetical protein
MTTRFIELNFRPDRRALRQFGFFGLIGFGVLAQMAFHEAGLFALGLGVARLPLASGFCALGLLSALFSLLCPQANRPIYVATSLIAYPLGFLLSYLILAFLYFVVFGIVALAMRLRGRDPMARARDPEAESYWSPHRPNPSSDRYFRQF